jgi:hypothetical protein
VSTAYFAQSGAALLTVAFGAVHARGRGEEAHGPHELLDGNSFEKLDVLEDLLG